RAASSIRRLSSSAVSISPVFIVTSPRTIFLSLGTKRSGEKLPARGESYSRKKPSSLNSLNRISAPDRIRPRRPRRCGNSPGRYGRLQCTDAPASSRDPVPSHRGQCRTNKYQRDQLPYRFHMAEQEKLSAHPDQSNNEKC